MKILWLSHLVPYPAKAGVILRCDQLITELSKENSIDLLCFHQHQLMRPLVKDLEIGLEEGVNYLSQYVNVAGVYEIPAEKNKLSKYWLAGKSLFSRYGYTINWLDSNLYDKAIEGLIADNNYNLIHIDTVSFYKYHHIFTELKTPFVLDHHNIESHMMKRRADKETNLIKKLYFKQEAIKLEKFELKMVENASCNITCSDMDSERLKILVPHAWIETIPNGVNTRYFKQEVESEKIRRLIFFGTMNWYPNITAVEYIIENIAGPVQNMFPEVSIDIVGANPPDHISQLAQQYNNVTIHGFVDDIRQLMQDAIFLCPIKDGGGTKLKILDALSFGMPIIADPIACEGINVHHEDDILLAETAEQYIHSINIIINNDWLMKNLSRNARKLAINEYSVEIIGKKLRQLYKKLSK